MIARYKNGDTMTPPYENIFYKIPKGCSNDN